MAQIVISKKGFKSIKTSMSEMSEILDSPCICDYCNGTPGEGYLVAVLNSWYCPECYHNWEAKAKFHAVDAPYESSVFEQYKNIFKSCLTS